MKKIYHWCYYYRFNCLNKTKKHRHLVKNDALGVIYNLNVKGKIIIQFTCLRCKEKRPGGRLEY